MKSIRVHFLFASKGIGGAERSMLRLISLSHQNILDCCVIFCGNRNLEMESVLQELKIPFYRVGKINIFRLYRLFVALKPDIVYIFGIIRSIPWAIAARIAGVPAVIGAERGSGMRWRDHIGRYFDKYLIDGYITNSQFSAQILTKFSRIPKENIFVVHNGIEEDAKTLPQVPEVLQDSKPFVVCVANIKPRKGQKVLLEAIKKVQKDFPELRAVLVGKDFTKGRFFREMNGKGLEKTFFWTGYVPDVRGILSKAKVFILPSIDSEGMPTAILEAMIAGLPIIATNVAGGVKELVQDGKNGYIIPLGDPDTLAQKIFLLLKSPEDARRLGENGREHVLNNFTVHMMLQNHVHVFKTILSAHYRRKIKTIKKLNL